MYGHGIVTLMLTEMLGMGADEEQNARIEKSAQRAIDLILSAQKQSKPSQYVGAWRYTPNRTTRISPFPSGSSRRCARPKMTD